MPTYAAGAAAVTSALMSKGLEGHESMVATTAMAAGAMAHGVGALTPGDIDKDALTARVLSPDMLEGGHLEALPLHADALSELSGNGALLYNAQVASHPLWQNKAQAQVHGLNGHAQSTEYRLEQTELQENEGAAFIGGTSISGSALLSTMPSTGSATNVGAPRNEFLGHDFPDLDGPDHDMSGKDMPGYAFSSNASSGNDSSAKTSSSNISSSKAVSNHAQIVANLAFGQGTSPAQANYLARSTMGSHYGEVRDYRNHYDKLYDMQGEGQPRPGSFNYAHLEQAPVGLAASAAAASAAARAAASATTAFPGAGTAVSQDTAEVRTGITALSGSAASSSSVATASSSAIASSWDTTASIRNTSRASHASHNTSAVPRGDDAPAASSFTANAGFTAASNSTATFQNAASSQHTASSTASSSASASAGASSRTATDSSTGVKIKGLLPAFKLSWRTIGKVLLKNDQLLVVFLSTIMLYTAFGIFLGASISIFIENHILNNPLLYAIVLVSCLLQLLAMVSFEPLVRYTSRAFVFNLGVYLIVLGALVLLFVQEDMRFIFPIVTVSACFSSIGLGLTKVALTSMTIDTVDYGDFKLSVRTDGLIFSLRAMAHRIGETIALFFYGGALLTAYVFDSRHAIGLPFSINWAIFMVVILSLVTIFIYYNFYKLNGAFYRNILNNLQYLRQNQKAAHETHTPNRFMLRYSLDESTMIIKLKAQSQDELIRALVQKLSEVNAITSEHDYMCDLNARLNVGPCGVAEGIALPHAKSSAVRRATVVVATLDTPLDLGALDGRKCNLIFLLASPDDPQTHLNLLARLSLLLNEPGFADKLRASGSSTELFERLIQCEKHIVTDIGRKAKNSHNLGSLAPLPDNQTNMNPDSIYNMPSTYSANHASSTYSVQTVYSVPNSSHAQRPYQSATNYSAFNHYSASESYPGKDYSELS